MTESRSTKQHSKSEAPAEPVAAAGSSANRKQRILWVAVSGMTAIIVLLWVLLLPLQIREWKFGSMSDLADRWRVVREENQPPASFRESLDRIYSRLVESSAKDRAVLTQQNNAASVVDVARLRAKLEANSTAENILILPENAAPKDQGTK